MTKLQSFLVIGTILLSLLPLWGLNQWLQKVIGPRRSFGQFLLYMLVCFALVFLYTFLITGVVFRLFPPPAR